MIIFFRLLALAACALSPLLVRATSILPPTFDELVAEADTIVRGTVAEVRCVTVETSRGPAIHTLVTLQVERALKGSAAETVTLRLLGGTVGKRTLTVDGLPQFHAGQRTVVFFANNHRTMCPVIGARHGRFLIERDAATNTDVVLRDNRRPLTSVEDVPLPFAPPVAARALSAPALSLGAFEASVSSALQKTVPTARPR